MKNEIDAMLELLEKEYLNTRSEEEKEELKKIFKEIEEEANNYIWLS